MNTRRRRVILAILLGLATGPAFALLTERYVERWPRPPVLEYDPGTAYISRYLGHPDEEEEAFEAKPADAPSQPNLDRFYRTIATRVKARVNPNASDYAACVLGLGACWGDGGWPFVSREVSYSVSVDEYLDPKRSGLTCFRFRAAEYGDDPSRYWAWWANAGVGFLLSISVFVGGLTLMATFLSRPRIPVAGFPVIVSGSLSSGADAIAECALPQE